jgi:hypothetical protein
MAKDGDEKYEGKRETEEDEVKEGHSAKFLRGAAKMAERKHGGKRGHGKRGMEKK